VRYLGAIVFTFSMNAVSSFSSTPGGDVVRVATGIPTSTEELLQSRRKADAKHPYRTPGTVVKLMRSVGGNIQCLACAHDQLPATEGRFHLTFEQDKGLLVVMRMGRGPATWRDVHINDAKASIGPPSR